MIFAFVLVSLAVVIFGAKVRKENADGSCSSFFSGESWGDGDAGGCGGGGCGGS